MLHIFRLFVLLINLQSYYMLLIDMQSLLLYFYFSLIHIVHFWLQPNIYLFHLPLLIGLLLYIHCLKTFSTYNLCTHIYIHLEFLFLQYILFFHKFHHNMYLQQFPYTQMGLILFLCCLLHHIYHLFWLVFHLLYTSQPLIHHK